MRELGILVLGEALLDMMILGEEEDALIIKAYTGGSPANTAAATARLGIETHFISILGQDGFGEHIRRDLESFGVQLNHTLTRESHPLLAVVFVDEKGMPAYSFRREKDFPVSCQATLFHLPLNQYRIIHTGSLGLLLPAYRRVFLPVVRRALEQGIPLSLDPNIRSVPDLDKREYRELLLSLSKEVELFKASDEDLFFLLGENYRQKIKELRFHKPTFLTQGEKGSWVFLEGEEISIPAEEVPIQDTTGCGDAYMGGVLASLLQEEIWHLPVLMEAAWQGSRMAGIVACSSGALAGIRQLGDTLH